MRLGRAKLTPLEAGARAPEFQLSNLDGGETSLATILSAGPALLAFFKISCPVCQLAFPYFERLQKPGKPRVYGISQNSAKDTREFARRYGLSLPVLLDAEDAGFPASNAYGLTNVPTAFLVNADATIARTIHGWNKAAMSELAQVNGASLFGPDDHVPEWKAG